MTPFDRIEWWQGLEAECGIKPLIAVARDGDDMAILPLQTAKGRFEALGNWYNFTARPIISAGAPAMTNALLSALATDLRRNSWRITLAPLPDEDPVVGILGDAFAKAGWSIRREQCDVNRFAELSSYDGYADFLAQRPGHLRTTLKRKSSKAICTVYRIFTEDIWMEYEAVYRASWKPPEGSYAFLRRFAQQEAAAGRLRLGIARHDGTAVAAQLWTVEQGTAFIHKLAHIEASKSLSAGTSLSAALFAHVIDIDHALSVDFGTGDDPYKREWMNGVRPRYRFDMLDTRNPRAWPHLVRDRLRRREALETLVSPAGAG